MRSRAARADAPDVYEDNAVEEGDEEADAALLKLPQKRKQKHRAADGDKGGGAGAQAG